MSEVSSAIIRLVHASTCELLSLIVAGMHNYANLTRVFFFVTPRSEIALPSRVMRLSDPWQLLDVEVLNSMVCVSVMFYKLFHGILQVHVSRTDNGEAMAPGYTVERYKHWVQGYMKVSHPIPAPPRAISVSIAILRSIPALLWHDGHGPYHSQPIS